MTPLLGHPGRALPTSQTTSPEFPLELQAPVTRPPAAHRCSTLKPPEDLFKMQSDQITALLKNLPDSHCLSGSGHSGFRGAWVLWGTPQV